MQFEPIGAQAAFPSRPPQVEIVFSVMVGTFRGSGNEIATPVPLTEATYAGFPDVLKQTD